MVCEFDTLLGIQALSLVHGLLVSWSDGTHLHIWTRILFKWILVRLILSRLILGKLASKAFLLTL